MEKNKRLQPNIGKNFMLECELECVEENLSYYMKSIILKQEYHHLVISGGWIAYFL